MVDLDSKKFVYEMGLFLFDLYALAERNNVKYCTQTYLTTQKAGRLIELFTVLMQKRVMTPTGHVIVELM